MNSRVTLTDVAKRAGVHYTTVSLALRNHPRLPKATRQRLCEIAEHMGYRPDPLLHALSDYRNAKKDRHGVTTVAYLTNWSSRWGWRDVAAEAEIFQGAEERATKLGYKLEHFWRGESQMTDQRLTDVLRARGITGILLASDPNEGNGFPQLNWAGFTAIQVGSWPRFSPINRVTHDRTSAIYTAIQHVIAAGYQRIGVVLDERWEQAPELIGAAAGFERSLSGKPYTLSHFVFSNCNSSDRAAPTSSSDQTKNFSAWMTTRSPEVLISTTTLIRPILQNLDLDAFRNLAFVDFKLQNADGEIAGVKENCRFLGEVAVEALAGQLAQHLYGVPAIPTTTLINGTWVDGRSLPPLVKRS